MKRYAVVILLVVFAAIPMSAQMGRQRIMMPSPVAGMDSLALELAPDGTVVTTRTVPSQSGISQEVVAISPAGTIVWESKADQPIGYVTLSGNLVLVATTPMTSPMGVSPVTTIHALALSDGHEVWKNTIDGMVVKIDANATTIYVLGTAGMMVYNGSGMTSGPNVIDARTLYAFNASNGVLLWSQTLSPTH